MLVDLRNRKHDAVDIIMDPVSNTITLDPVTWEEISDDRLDEMIT